jgi:hypothetical protein
MSLRKRKAHYDADDRLVVLTLRRYTGTVDVVTVVQVRRKAVS